MVVISSPSLRLCPVSTLLQQRPSHCQTRRSPSLWHQSIPTVITNLKLVICASEPQSNGISKAYAKAAEFIAPQTPVTTAIALKSAYDNKYGAPSEGKPKVFVKYFYVNTDMLFIN